MSKPTAGRVHFRGASDDIVIVDYGEHDSPAARSFVTSLSAGGEEWYVGDNNTVRFRLTYTNGQGEISGLDIAVSYDFWDGDGVWWTAVAPLSEGIPMLKAEISDTPRGTYTTELIVWCPGGTVLERIEDGA